MSTVTSSVTDELPGVDATDEGLRQQRREPPAWIMVSAFSVISFFMIFRNPTRLRSYVVSDLGDPILNLWIVGWVSGHLFDGWSAIWNAGNFYPARNTLAYSETMFPMALSFGLLKPFFGSILAYNLLIIAQWTLAAYCTYRLCMYFTHSWVPSSIAALAFTFSTIRTIHYGHTQLAASWLIPLALLAAVRLFDRPSWKKGIALGLSLAVLTLSASYYGELMAVALVVVCVLGLVIMRGSFSKTVAALGVAVVVSLLLVAPFANQYLRLQEDPYFRRAPDQQFAARLGDYFAVSHTNYVWGSAPIMESRSAETARNVERRLFPGGAILALGVVGFAAVFLTRARWRNRWIEISLHQKKLLALVASAGTVGLLLSFGQYLEIGSARISMPSAWLRDIVPGFEGIRAPSRFAVLAVVALAVFAALGAYVLLKMLPSRVRLLCGIALMIVVLAETSFRVALAPVPTVERFGEVNTALADRPAGAVVELPIRNWSDVDWAATEPSRQLLALSDGHPRVNGYSGWQPQNFIALTTALNSFPSTEAFASLDEIGVRYVVLRTKAVGDFPPELTYVYSDGMGRMSSERADAIVNSLPADRVDRVDRYKGAILIELDARDVRT